jgi:hypothetical protein
MKQGGTRPTGDEDGPSASNIDVPSEAMSQAGENVPLAGYSQKEDPKPGINRFAVRFHR